MRCLILVDICQASRWQAESSTFLYKNVVQQMTWMCYRRFYAPVIFYVVPFLLVWSVLHMNTTKLHWFQAENLGRAFRQGLKEGKLPDPQSLSVEAFKRDVLDRGYLDYLDMNDDNAAEIFPPGIFDDLKDIDPNKIPPDQVRSLTPIIDITDRNHVNMSQSVTFWNKCLK